MIKAKHVADYFLTLSEPEIGDIISNLKLQKLVYYAQGFHLALYNNPLFEDEIVAWAHGPVVTLLYQEFKEHGADPIPVPTDFDDSVFTAEQKDLLNEVYQVYGQYSAWKLRNMTHEEEPWKSTSLNEVISQSKMKSYFKTQLIDD